MRGPLISRAGVAVAAPPPVAAADVGLEELDSAITVVSLDGLQPTTPLTSGATWSATNMNRAAGGGIQGTSYGVSCVALIEAGAAVDNNHTWQIRDAGDATIIDIVWAGTGDPTGSGTGYTLRLSRASTSSAWNVSMRKLGTGTITPGTIRRWNSTDQLWNGATTLTGIVPDSETRISVRVGATATTTYASVDWGDWETIYLESTDVAHRGTLTGVVSVTPSGTHPKFQTKLNLGYFSPYRRKRLTNPTVYTIDQNTPLTEVSSAQFMFTADGHAYSFEEEGDIIVRTAPGFTTTYPVYARSANGYAVIQGIEGVMAVQPGSGKGELEMSDGSPSIRARMPSSNGGLKVDAPNGFCVEGCNVDVPGMSCDWLVIRGGDQDGNNAYLADNLDGLVRFFNATGWRNDHASAGDGAHGDFLQNQGMIMRSLAISRGIISHWGSHGVLEWAELNDEPGDPTYYDGAYRLHFDGFDTRKDTRFSSGDPEWHSGDDGWNAFMSGSFKSLYIFSPCYWNWFAGSGHHGNYMPAERRLYDASGSSPSTGYYQMSETPGVSYLGQGETPNLSEFITYDTDRVTPQFSVSKIGALYVSPDFDDL